MICFSNCFLKTIHKFSFNGTPNYFSLQQKNFRTTMQKLSQMFIQHQPISAQNEKNWIKIRIAIQNAANDCDAMMEEKKLVIKMNQKWYQINSDCKMQPRYTQNGKIQHINVSLKNKNMKITACDQASLQIAYLPLKRQISHKGFNEYFKPLKRLGKGSFATVYLVQHKYTGEKFAAKVFSRESQKIGYMGYQALLNQIKLLKTFHHPNIIRYDGLYETENLIYLVTQYLSGGTLAQFMRNKSTLMGDFITNILQDSLKALKYLQENHIMHRDFKPQNIIMRQSDQKWVLADFGLGACVNQKYLYDKCGTMGYIAPQILDQNQQQKPYNSSCDVYSLGVVAYNLIVGCLPFKVEGGMFDRKMIWDAFTKQQSVGLGQEILELLKGLLEKDPRKRLSPQQALSSSFFTDPKVIENWKTFNQKRIQDTYTRVLKLKNN